MLPQFHHILSRGRQFHVIRKAKVHATRSFICSNSNRRCHMSQLPPDNSDCCRSNWPRLGHIPRPDIRRCLLDNRKSPWRNQSSSYFPTGSRCRRRSTGSRGERTPLHTIPNQERNRRVSLQLGLCLMPPMSRERRGHLAQVGIKVLFSAYPQTWKSPPSWQVRVPQVWLLDIGCYCR